MTTMTRMIAVKVMYNTEPDGSEVDVLNTDWDDIKAPQSIYGPFDSIEDAVIWMNELYPDSDMDVYDMEAGEYDIPDDWYVNPASTIQE